MCEALAVGNWCFASLYFTSPLVSWPSIHRTNCRIYVFVRLFFPWCFMKLFSKSIYFFHKSKMLYSLLVFVYLSLSAVSQCAAASWTAWWELLLSPKVRIVGSALRAWANLILLSTCSDHSGGPCPCVFHHLCVTSLEWASQSVEDTRMITSGNLKLVKRAHKLRENWIQDQSI